MTQPKLVTQKEAGVFDDSESWFYAKCVYDFLLANKNVKHIVELGTGSGEAIIYVLESKGVSSEVIVDGYEIHSPSAEVALSTAIRYRLDHRYKIFCKDFFEAAKTTSANCAIANPPYLPSLIRPTITPEFWGGKDGSAVTKRMFEHNFESIVLIMSSYSDPASVIGHAKMHGYKVSNYQVTLKPYGRYSREFSVQRRIRELIAEGRAFVSGSTYNVAGVTWVKQSAGPDLSEQLFERLRFFKATS